MKLTGAQLTRDGFITSKTTGRKFGDIDDRLFRGDLLWSPSDDVTFRFVAESTDLDRNGSARTLEEIRLDECAAAGLQLGRLSVHESHSRVGVRRRRRRRMGDDVGRRERRLRVRFAARNDRRRGAAHGQHRVQDDHGLPRDRGPRLHGLGCRRDHADRGRPLARERSAHPGIPDPAHDQRPDRATLRVFITGTSTAPRGRFVGPSRSSARGSSASKP